MLIPIWEWSYHWLSKGCCCSLKVPRDLHWGPPEAEHLPAPPPPHLDSQSARLGHPQKFQHHSYHCPKNEINQSVLELTPDIYVTRKYWRIGDTDLWCLCGDSVRFDILPFLIILTLLSYYDNTGILETTDIFIYSVSQHKQISNNCRAWLACRNGGHLFLLK